MKRLVLCLVAVVMGGLASAELQTVTIDSTLYTRVFLVNSNQFEGDVEGYAIENGVITCKPGGVMYTKQEFENFTISFEFQLTPGANNGIGLFMQPGDGRTSVDGIEIQVLDDTADEYKDIEPWQHHGSIYGIVPAEQGHLKPVGEWNQESITVKDRQITVVLNGATITDANLDEATKEPTPDGKEHPGAKRTKGRIGFLGHGRVLSFRNVVVAVPGTPSKVDKN